MEVQADDTGLGMNRKAVKAAFPNTVPVMLGYVFMGAAFGILLSSKGYAFWWATLSALFVYCGSMQFVMIDLLTDKFDLFAVIVMTVAVNARHLFYGLSLIDKYKGMGAKKIYAIFGLTDETYSLVCSQKPPLGVDENRFYFFTTLLNHLYWITGCTLGGLFGSLYTFNTKGIDFVMTALFVVIFVEQWESAKVHSPALIGVGATFLCLVVFGGDIFLIPSMAVIAFLLSLLKKPMEARLEA